MNFTCSAGFGRRVKATRRHHVRLVDDEDFVAVTGGSGDRALAKTAGVIHAAASRRIDRHHVERPAALPRQLDATGALTARGVGGAFHAVDAAGEDAGRREFTAAARPAEEGGVIHPVAAGAAHNGSVTCNCEIRSSYASD